MKGPRTRFAPTPSGYLHLGNAWSFVLTWLLARSRGGSIHLRIDDLDAARLRPEYLEDIFESLRWLGLDWDTGPRDTADFLARHSQRLRLDRYREAMGRLSALRGPDGPAVFACACSREQVKRAARVPGLYPGTCRSLGLDPATPGTTLRLHVPEEEEAEALDGVSGRLRLRPGRLVGDFILRQKNGDPAYQLASVVDDEDLGIDLVVRGSDLLPSTAAQLALARRLGAQGFLGAEFVHHGLIVRGEAGEGGKGPEAGKISKSSMGSSSAGATVMEGSSAGPHPDDTALRTLRARLGSPGRIYAFFARTLGQDLPDAARAADLLPGFRPERIPAGPLRWEDFQPG